MIVAMFFGLSESFGTVPWPMAALANAALIVQFPLAHPALLTGPGGCLPTRLIRQPIQVAFALTLWTPPVWTPDQLVLAVSFTAYCLPARA